ncbi:MAG: rhamnogalacturonan lyase B N-terminal domain-containing protein, partial [Trebonia sp.]
MITRGSRAPSRREFLAGTGGLAALLGGLAVGELTLAPPARAATAFGYTSSGGRITVSTGAGLTFTVNQSDGDMTSLNYNGTELQDQSSFSQVESGLGSGASVTVNQTGNSIVVTESVTDWYGSGTLHHYLVAVSGQNNIYMATYVNSAGAGELRWISRLNSSVITTVVTPAEINGGTAIESTDIYLLDGQTRSKYYSNRQAMELTVRGIAGSGIGVYMAYGNRESSAGGPFFRDIEQQGTTDNQLYNYLWSAHNQTEPQRLGVLYGPYALMVANETTPATPDMSFMDGLGLIGNVPASGRGYVAGGAYGATSGTTVTVGWANSTAQYWATAQSNGDYYSPAMK